MSIPLQKALSAPRYLSYKLKASEVITNPGYEQDKLSEELYIFNMEISSSLYIALNMLEICFRNSFSEAISSSIPNWLDYDLLNNFRNNDFYNHYLIGDGKTIFQKCIVDYEGKKTITNSSKRDYIVSNLSFGFWVHCLKSNYRNFWTQSIKDIFPNLDANIYPQDITTAMFSALRLRNDVMHHSFILDCNLQSEYDSILRLIRYISKDAKNIVSGKSKFRKILDSDPRNTFKSIKLASESNFICASFTEKIKDILDKLNIDESNYIIIRDFSGTDKLYDLKSLVSAINHNISLSDSDMFIVDNQDFLSSISNISAQIKFGFYHEDTKIKSLNKRDKVIVMHDNNQNITGMYFIK